MAGAAIARRPLVVISFHPDGRSDPRAPFTTFPPLRRSPIPTRLRFRYSPRFSSPPKQNPNPSQDFSVGKSGLNHSSAPRFLLNRIRVDEISMEILYIALPAALALAADPIASLVDTAFVGHLGSVELAAVGVSISIFNLVSKLFNVPLLNITTSFVAEQQALEDNLKNSTQMVNTRIKDSGSESMTQGGTENKKFLPAVSTSLALAAGIGVLEAIALSLGSGLLMNIMGIPVDSPMRIPAEQFLTLRAYGAPAIVVALAAQGTFRGFMDTKTPLYAVGFGNFLNVVLDAVLILHVGLGVDGAAIATVTSEYMIAFILLWKLNEKVILISPNIIENGVVRYIKSGGLLIGRTIAVLLTMTLATSVVAREGPILMAGHQICLQIWLAVSLLNDALALAGQALLASEYARGNYKQARLIVYKVLQIGAITGFVLAIFLFFVFVPFSSIFTTDSAVLDISRSGILFVTASQPVNAIAFVFDGLYYGVSDFEYAAYSMVLVGLVSSIFILTVAPVFGIAGVWTGLFLFMALRAAAGFWRLGTKGGPWVKVWSEMEIGMTED